MRPRFWQVACIMLGTLLISTVGRNYWPDIIVHFAGIAYGFSCAVCWYYDRLWPTGPAQCRGMTG